MEEVTKKGSRKFGMTFAEYSTYFEYQKIDEIEVNQCFIKTLALIFKTHLSYVSELNNVVIANEIWHEICLQSDVWSDRNFAKRK